MAPRMTRGGHRDVTRANDDISLPVHSAPTLSLPFHDLIMTRYAQLPLLLLAFQAVPAQAAYRCYSSCQLS